MLGGQQGLLLGEVLLSLLHSPSRIGRKHSAWQGRPWTRTPPTPTPTPPQRWALRRAAGYVVSRLQSECRPPFSPQLLA